MRKRDVNRAFKWVWVKDEHVEEFAASLPGEAAGKVIMIHLCMVFGWSGAPGEYMIFAWAAQKLHESYRPALPAVNDTVNFSSRWLMDDAVILEPAVGLRPWISAECLEESMRAVWGGEAINDDKKDEEGIP